ncbi:MAG TPA: hypothetical protein VD931_13135 [Baekduia sp.]|nr:hypothetical protein [Baekduia sp.]
MRRAVLLVALAAAAFPAAAAAQEAPQRVARAGGVYVGAVSVNDHRCGRDGCRVTLVASDDGLELTPESSVALGRCYDGPLDHAPISDRGRWSTLMQTSNGGRDVRGRAARNGRTITGSGSALCDAGDDSRPRGFRFTARLVRTRKAPPAGAPRSCRRIETTRFTQRWAAVVRGLGCGRAHHAARQVAALRGCAAVRRARPAGSCRASGLRCAPAGPDRLDPAAQVRCSAGGRVVDLVRLADCGSAGQNTFVWAAPAVGCQAAKALGAVWEDRCTPASDDPVPAPCEVRGFRCVAVPDETDPEDVLHRCTDLADPRRAVELLWATSDVV